jgi:Fe-S-cluster containining protein
MDTATITPQMQSEARTHGLNVERIALRVIREDGTAADAMRRGQEMYDSVMQKVDAKYHPTYACKPGCVHCCSCEISVTQPEAELLARHLTQTMTPDQIEALKDRMRAVIAERQAGGRARCAFLGADNLCTVYAVRPMKCRACNSEDVEPCRRWEEGKDDSSCLRVFMLPRMYALLTVFGVLKAATPASNPQNAPHTELNETLLKLL